MGVKSAGDKYDLELTSDEKVERVSLLLEAIQSLWTVGRQSRFLSDMSPKFVSAALLRVKNPIFLESVFLQDNIVQIHTIKQTINDFEPVLVEHILGERKGFFGTDHEGVGTVGEAFFQMKNWLQKVYLK